MRVALADLRKVAPSIGWPRDKTALTKRLRMAGCFSVKGLPVQGGSPLTFEVDRLPVEFRIALASETLNVQPHTEMSPNSEEAGRYLAAPRSCRDEADRKLNMVWRVIRLKEDGATARQAALKAADEFEVSPSTVKGAFKLVQDRPQEKWLDLLTPAYKGRAKREIDERIVNAFIADYGRVEQPTAQACYERVCRRAAAGGWGAVPPLKTLQRRFEDLPARVRKLMREGEPGLLKTIPHQERDRSGKSPLDSTNMDSRTWDLRVMLSSGVVFRPVITINQDEATNFILGYEVTETESGASYRRVMCAAFTAYGLPRLVRFDNTRAAANKKTTAGAKGRFRFTDRADDVPGLLPTLGIETAFTKPYNGRAKLVERCFAELKERSEKDPRLAGAYTGRSPSEKPANYGERAVPMALFLEVLAEAVQHYNDRVDRRSSVAWRTSHRAVFEAGLKSVAVRRLTEAQRRLFFLSAERRTVTSAGSVTIGTGRRLHRYAHEALVAYAGRDVVVRYDENDFSAPILAETLEGRTIVDAVPRIEAGGFDSTEAARAHGRHLRAAKRKAREVAAHYASMDAIDAAEIAPAVAASPIPTFLETPVVRGTFDRHRAARTPTVPPEEPVKPIDWRDITKLAIDAENLRWGAA